MLKIDNLKKQYDAFSLDVSMEVAPGRITGLIGKNGAGKRNFTCHGLTELILRFFHTRKQDWN